MLLGTGTEKTGGEQQRRADQAAHELRQTRDNERAIQEVNERRQRSAADDHRRRHIELQAVGAIIANRHSGATHTVPAELDFGLQTPSAQRRSHEDCERDDLGGGAAVQSGPHAGERAQAPKTGNRQRGTSAGLLVDGVRRSVHTQVGEERELVLQSVAGGPRQ